MEETQVVTEAPTQNPAPEAAQQTPEVAEPETEAQEQPEGEQQDDPADKAIKAMQRRISRLTANKYQAQAEADQLRREVEALRARTQEAQEQPQQQVDPVALATEIAAIKEATIRSNQVAEQGAKKFGKEEFSKAIATVIEEAGPLVKPIQPGAQIGKPTPLGEAILDSDDPAAVLHYLGSNPDVAAELQGLSPLQVARRIAKIETQIEEQRKPKVSNAPKPVTPVKATSGSDNDLSPDLPLSEWMRRREEQLKGKRR